MLKGRPGFEAGPRPRPIWAWKARPGFRPGLNKIKEFKLFFSISFGLIETKFRALLLIFDTFDHLSGYFRPNLVQFL
jgi:hypothetical protein